MILLKQIQKLWIGQSMRKFCDSDIALIHKGSYITNCVTQAPNYMTQSQVKFRLINDKLEKLGEEASANTAATEA